VVAARKDGKERLMGRKTRGLLATLLGVTLALVAVLGAAPHVALANAETTYNIVVKNGAAEI
jgi:hypothetical protein